VTGGGGVGVGGGAAGLALGFGAGALVFVAGAWCAAGGFSVCALGTKPAVCTGTAGTGACC
jgi:hypothetical protein